VIARQYELGFRGRIGTGLSLIGSVFEVSKPTPGLDPDGVYRLIGEESHRGVELSLTGRVTPSLTTVAGLVVLDPKMSGELVRLGRQSDRAMGVSSVIGVASFNYEPPPLPGLSIDGQLTYNGDRLVHPTNGLETPAHTLVDLGGRYRFRIHRHDAVLRVYAGNIFGTNAWTGLRSGSMLRTAPRSLRATLTVSFD
jgi:iron complex outermembrane receptor protein